MRISPQNRIFADFPLIATEICLTLHNEENKPHSTPMAKYNITEKKTKAPLYHSTLSEALMDELFQKIMGKLLVEKKYRDPKYTARTMAEELGTNTRYISAAINVRNRDNYPQLVNEFRIKEAMHMLSDPRYADMKMEDIGITVGFANRQSFYAAFFRRLGVSPFEYRKQTLSLMCAKNGETAVVKRTRRKKKDGL